MLSILNEDLTAMFKVTADLDGVNKIKLFLLAAGSVTQRAKI